MDDESDEQGYPMVPLWRKPAKMVLQWIGSYGKRPKHRVYQNGIFFDQSNELCDMEYDGYDMTWDTWHVAIYCEKIS